MQPNSDFIALMTTEIGRLVIMIFFYFLAIRPIKLDVHAMANKINTIFIKLAEGESFKRRVDDLKVDLNKFEDRLHSVELQQRKCHNTNRPS